MPRKHHRKWNHIKPLPQPSHFSLSSALSPVGSTTTSPHSVNSLLSHLRSSQSHHHDASADNDSPPSPVTPATVVTPSVPPGLQLILGTPLPPPPRPRLRAGGPTARARRIPGPPPPLSWLQQPQPAPAPRSTTSSASTTSQVSSSSPFSSFPALAGPPQDSLAHFSLMQLARHWDFHRVYDMHYLPLLPPRIRSLLLQYLAAYYPAPIDALGLMVLFADEEEEVTHLTLPHTAVGELIPVFRPVTPSAGNVADSWDAAPASSTRFPVLTHLCLAAPSSNDVKALLKLLELTPGVTYLSLAGWRLTGNVRGIVKRTLCLRWLECEGALVDELLEVEAVWTGVWRGIEKVVLAGVKPGRARVLERFVRAARNREGRGGWFRAVTVEEEEEEEEAAAAAAAGDDDL